MHSRFSFVLLQLSLLGCCACARPRPNLSTQLPPAQAEPEPAPVAAAPVLGLRPESRDGQQVLTHATLGFWFRAPSQAYTRDPGTEEMMRGQLGEELPSSEITAFRDPEGHVLLVMTIGPQGLPPGLPEELTPRLEVLHRARFANGAQVREQWIDRARSQTYAANDQPPLVSNGRLMSRADGIHVVQLSTMGPISEELLQVIHSLELPPALPAPREQLEAFIAGVGPGRWNWEKDAACKSDGETFVFSADRTRVELRHDKEVESFDGSKTAHFSYRVLAWEPRRVRMAIEGETRLDRHGKPVIWDLIMSEDQSSLCWARNDWPPLECTSKLVRCPQ